MWPFSSLSPRTRKLLAAFAIAAKLVFSFQDANAASAGSTAMWQDARTAKVTYDRTKTAENESILRRALENLLAQLKKDLQKLPEGSAERNRIGQEIAALELKLASLSQVEATTIKFPKEVTAAVQIAAQQIADGTYDFSKPLTARVKNNTLVLVTPDKLRRIARETYTIKDRKQREQAIALMITTEISKGPAASQLRE